jgi:hypothetical protein
MPINLSLLTRAEELRRELSALRVRELKLLAEIADFHRQFRSVSSERQSAWIAGIRPRRSGSEPPGSGSRTVSSEEQTNDSSSPSSN